MRVNAPQGVVRGLVEHPIQASASLAEIAEVADNLVEVTQALDEAHDLLARHAAAAWVSQARELIDDIRKGLDALSDEAR